MIVCRHCGTDNASNLFVCQKCWKPLGRRALSPCLKCGRSVSPDATCPGCGYSRQTHRLGWIIFGCFIFYMLAHLLGSMIR